MKKRRSSEELFDRIKLEMIMKIHRVPKKRAKEMLTPPLGRGDSDTEPLIELDEELISADEFFGN